MIFGNSAAHANNALLNNVGSAPSSQLMPSLTEISDIEKINASLARPANHLTKKTSFSGLEPQQPLPQAINPEQSLAQNLESSVSLDESTNFVTKHTNAPIDGPPIGNQPVPNVGNNNIVDVADGANLGKDAVGQDLGSVVADNVSKTNQLSNVPTTSGGTVSDVGSSLVEDTITQAAQDNIQNQLVKQGVKNLNPVKGNVADQLIAKSQQIPKNNVARGLDNIAQKNLAGQQQLQSLDQGLSAVQQKNVKLLKQLHQEQAGFLGGGDMQQAIAQQQQLVAQVNQLENTKAALGGVLATTDGLKQQVQVLNGLTSIVSGKPSGSLTKLVSSIAGTQDGALGQISQMVEYVDAYNAASKLAKHLPIARQVSRLADAVTGPFAAVGNGLMDLTTSTMGAAMQLPIFGAEVLADQITDGLAYITPNFIKDGYNYIADGMGSLTKSIQDGMTGVASLPMQGVLGLQQTYRNSRIPYPLQRLMIAEGFENEISTLKNKILSNDKMLALLDKEEALYLDKLRKHPNHPYFMNKLNKIRQQKSALLVDNMRNNNALEEREGQYNEFLEEDKKQIQKYVEENEEEIDRAIRKCNPKLTEEDLKNMDDMQKFAIYSQIQQANFEREQKFELQRGGLMEAAGAVAVTKFKYDAVKQGEKQIKERKKFIAENKKQAIEGGEFAVGELEKQKGDVAEQAQKDLTAIDGNITNAAKTKEALTAKEQELTSRIRALDQFIRENPGTPEADQAQILRNDAAEERNFVQQQTLKVDNLIGQLFTQRETTSNQAIQNITAIEGQQAQVIQGVEQAVGQLTQQEAVIDQQVEQAISQQKQATQQELVQAFQTKQAADEAKFSGKPDPKDIAIAQQNKISSSMIYQNYLKSKSSK